MLGNILSRYPVMLPSDITSFHVQGNIPAILLSQEILPSSDVIAVNAVATERIRSNKTFFFTLTRG